MSSYRKNRSRADARPNLVVRAGSFNFPRTSPQETLAHTSAFTFKCAVCVHFDISSISLSLSLSRSRSRTHSKESEKSRIPKISLFFLFFFIRNIIFLFLRYLLLFVDLIANFFFFIGISSFFVHLRSRFFCLLNILLRACAPRDKTLPSICMCMKVNSSKNRKITRVAAFFLCLALSFSFVLSLD